MAEPHVIGALRSKRAELAERCDNLNNSSPGTEPTSRISTRPCGCSIQMSDRPTSAPGGSGHGTFGSGKGNACA